MPVAQPPTPSMISIQPPGFPPSFPPPSPTPRPPTPKLPTPVRRSVPGHRVPVVETATPSPMKLSQKPPLIPKPPTPVPRPSTPVFKPLNPLEHRFLIFMKS